MDGGARDFPCIINEFYFISCLFSCLPILCKFILNYACVCACARACVRVSVCYTVFHTAGDLPLILTTMYLLSSIYRYYLDFRLTVPSEYPSVQVE